MVDLGPCGQVGGGRVVVHHALMSFVPINGTVSHLYVMLLLT